MNQVLANIRKFDNRIEKKIPDKDFSISPEIQLLFKWWPVIRLLLAELTGTRTKNKFMGRIVMILVSEIILNSFVQPFKKLFRRRRPHALLKFNSFPSGHTATSFSGAQIFYSEVSNYSHALSAEGYIIAILTAAIRLYERKHWLSDVIAGAVIGIISAGLSQLIYEEVLNNKHR